MVIECVHIALQFVILGGAMECIAILIGYIINSVFNLMKAR